MARSFNPTPSPHEVKPRSCQPLRSRGSASPVTVRPQENRPIVLQNQTARVPELVNCSPLRQGSN